CLAHGKGSASIKVSQDSPSKGDIPKEPGLDLGKPECALVDKQGSLHSRQHLLNPRRRRVVRIRAKLQPHQLVARLSHARLARLLSVVFVEESIWQRLHDT